jgi:acetolactate synthase-1/2/3 large subunit
MLASLTAKNTTKYLSSKAAAGVFRHRAVIACAGLHTSHKTKNAAANP